MSNENFTDLNKSVTVAREEAIKNLKTSSSFFVVAFDQNQNAMISFAGQNVMTWCTLSTITQKYALTALSTTEIIKP